MSVISTDRVWGLGCLLALGGLLAPHGCMAQQLNVITVQQEPQHITEQHGKTEPILNQRNSAEVRRRVQSDVQRREADSRLAAQTVRHQVQQDLQQAVAKMSMLVAQQVPGVDERLLWSLLRARRLSQFDQSLAVLRQRHADWTPSAQLLAQRRQQQEVDIDAAFARADADGIEQVLQRYPEQFSCARIDHLWRAAELLAKAGRHAQALVLYRTVFPSCTPAVNRIATLYMAQQNLGQVGTALTQLIALEAQSGQRDADSESKFQRLQYDRNLNQLVALAPDSAAGEPLVQQLTTQIEAYHDAAAATLSGWVMLAHAHRDAAQSWFQRGLDWSANNVDAMLGLLQISLDTKDIAGAEAWLAQPLLAADARAREPRMRLSMLRADALNQQKDFATSMRALDESERLGANAQQTAQLRGWNLYGLGRYVQSAALFATQYGSKHDAASAEGWALSENARGALDRLNAMPEAQTSPLLDYVTALQSQQLFYRKQFIAAYALQRQTEQGMQQDNGDAAAIASLAPYLPQNLNGIDAASITSGVTFSNHAGADGQGHLDTLAQAIRGEWIDGTRQYNLRVRQLTLDAGNVSASTSARAIGVPATYQGSGQANAQDLRLAIDDSIWLTRFGRLSWQASAGAISGGAGGTDVNGQLHIGQQTAWGSWSVYAGSNPVTDSLLSWRGMHLPGSDQVWGDVRRNAVGVRGLWQTTARWSVSANVELAQLNGENVQRNHALALDLGAGYNLKFSGFDYFNLGPALHYLRYDNNQNQYDWGLGGYYSPQRSLSTGLASQFLSVEGRERQWSGNLELGVNTSSQSASSCLPQALPAAYASVSASAVNCGYSGSSANGMYAHLQLALVQRLSARWQIGVQGDLNVTPGRDRQYGMMLFLRYFFSDRDALFSRDLPQNMRDFYGQLDDGR